MNLLSWLRPAKDGVHHRGQARMTWAKSSAGRTISRTGLFLKRQIWLWPIIAVVLLSIIGFIVRVEIESTMRDGLQSQLQTVVDLEAAMLNTWYKSKNRMPSHWQITSVFAKRSTPFGNTRRCSDTDGNSVVSLRAKLAKLLGPALTAHRYAGYIVWDK